MTLERWLDLIGRCSITSVDGRDALWRTLQRGEPEKEAGEA